jgi:uracil phosphoribosyltransferase
MDKKVTILSKENSIVNRFLHEMRDEEIQKDRLRFRLNIERIAEVLAYEISKQLKYEKQQVTTPLGELEMELPTSEPVIVSILRAGIPMHNGFLRYFDKADNGFISAFRHHTKGNEFEIKVEYAAIHDLTDRTLIMVDPMLATGRSIEMCYKAIVPGFGTPEKLIIAAVIGSEDGVEYVKEHLPQAHMFIGAVDKELTAKSYIVPGLGDAGDLAFGAKA